MFLKMEKDISATFGNMAEMKAATRFESSIEEYQFPEFRAQRLGLPPRPLFIIADIGRIYHHAKNFQFGTILRKWNQSLMRQSQPCNAYCEPFQTRPSPGHQCDVALVKIQVAKARLLYVQSEEERISCESPLKLFCLRAQPD